MPTGVALEAGSRVIVMPDEGGIGEALVSRLEKIGVEVLLADGDREDEAFERQLEAWTQAGPVHGVYWLAALDAEPPLAELEPDAWHEGAAAAGEAAARSRRAAWPSRSGPRGPS